MKQRRLILSAALILSLTLTGCGKTVGDASSTSAPDGPAVSQPLEVPEKPLKPTVEPEPLPPVEHRWYPDLTDHLIPGSDYGPLVPFKGGSALEGESPYAVGLMTADGKVVVDPVLDNVYYCSYRDEAGNLVGLPILQLSKSLGADWSEQMEQVALAAQDGSWVTGFDYWGCIEFPGGLAVGDEERMSILNLENGQVLRSWTWKELGLSSPLDVAWVTGDAYCTAQWALGAIYLGDDDEHSVRLLNPETGAITNGDFQELMAYFDQTNRGHQVHMENKTLVLQFQGKEYRFPSPLPQCNCPSLVGEDRLFFEADGQCAVTTLEGQTILPLQPGSVRVLWDGGWDSLLAVMADRSCQLYSYEGNSLAKIPVPDGAYCVLTGPLVLVHDRNINCNSYYRPDTGECVFRNYLPFVD